MRYGITTLLPCLAAYLTGLRPSLAETPHFIFLGAVVLSALYGGIGPAFYATTLCTMLVQVLFVHPFSVLGLSAALDRMECMGLFMLVSLMVACLVSALRKERYRLQESEERYRILAETACDAILVIDDLGEIVFVNPVAERIFAPTASPLLGQNIARLLPVSVYQPNALTQQAESFKNAVAFELPGKEAAVSNLLLEMTLSACSRQGQRLYTAIIRDITRLNRGYVPAELGI